MRPPQGRPVAQLVADARRVHVGSLEEFSTAVLSSKRSVQRWQVGTVRPSDHQLAAMARLVHPMHPALAGEIAAAAGETLESLELQESEPPAPPQHPPMPRPLTVDAVVCAAADASDVPPSAVRGMLLAAFRRARELSLATDEVEQALEARSAPAPKKKR
jgi:hypothetical protein